MSFDLLKLDDAFIGAHGLPRPQWKLIFRQIEKDWPLEKKHDFWCAAQRVWLERLRVAMAEPYSILESRNHFILTANRGETQWMLDFAEELHPLVGGMLDGAISKEAFGKFAVLVFQGEARYWQYVRHFSKDNRPQQSAGVCIFDGDTHIAMPGVTNFRHVLIHEMVHARLGARLPHWVHEGMAQHIDRILSTRSRMLADRFPRSQHQIWWKNHGIQHLWSGEIFNDRRADRRHMAYELSEQIVNAMIKPDRAVFNAFLREADKKDGGEAACRECFGVGLGVWVQEILGEGDWGPRR